MSIDEQIRESLKKWCSMYGPAPTMLATVQSVDESSLTCDLVDDDGTVIPDVRLRPVLDGDKSLTIFPKPGTWALALRIETAAEWMLVAAASFDKVNINIGQTLLEQTADGFKISKGTSSLKNILTNIVEASQQIVVMYGNNPDYVKLAQALNDINNLLQ